MTVHLASSHKPAPDIISEAWGLISERITSDQNTRDAVTLILSYEELMVDTDTEPETRLMLPSDVSAKLDAFDEGIKRGLFYAVRNLCDPAYIKEQRQLIEEQKTKEAES